MLGRVPGGEYLGTGGESRARETRPRGRGRKGSPRPYLGAQPGTSVNTTLNSVHPLGLCPTLRIPGARRVPSPPISSEGTEEARTPDCGAESPRQACPGAQTSPSTRAVRSWARGTADTECGRAPKALRSPRRRVRGGQRRVCPQTRGEQRAWVGGSLAAGPLKGPRAGSHRHSQAPQRKLAPGTRGSRGELSTSLQACPSFPFPPAPPTPLFLSARPGGTSSV